MSYNGTGDRESGICQLRDAIWLARCLASTRVIPSYVQIAAAEQKFTPVPPFCRAFAVGTNSIGHDSTVEKICLIRDNPFEYASRRKCSSELA